LYFWGIYEMGFPEGSNMKAPRGYLNTLGAFFAFLKCPLFYVIRLIGKRKDIFPCNGC
jgi:hypothetical protein